MRAAADADDVGVADDDVDGLDRQVRAGRPTTCAKLVSWPWPLGCVPITTSTRPSGFTVISVRSRGAPIEDST